MGTKVGANIQAGVPAGTQKVQTVVGVNIFGLALQALLAMQKPPNTINGTTYTELYSFGQRIFSQVGTFQADYQNLSVKAGLAPTEIRVPAITYPIGPVILQIDGGARFKANLAAQITPNFGIPLSTSTVGAQLGAEAAAAGFIEGYAQLLVVRAGVGGQVDLIDANASVNARMAFDGTPPVVTVNAMAQFLKGRFYAFVDFLSFFPMSFKRLVDYELYKWTGYCVAAGTGSCPAK